jgi:hypothetical protein
MSFEINKAAPDGDGSDGGAEPRLECVFSHQMA